MSKENSPIVSIGQIDLRAELLKMVPDTEALPLLPTRDMVLFPGVTVPISLGRDVSLAAARSSQESGKPLGIVCQLRPDVDNPSLSDLHAYGVTATVLQVIDVPDGSDTKMAIVHAGTRFRILGAPEDGAAPGVKLAAKVKLLRDIRPRVSDREFPTLVEAIKTTTLRLMESFGQQIQELVLNIRNAPDSDVVVNMIATHTPFPAPEKIEMLKQSRIKERAFRLLSMLSRDEHKARLAEDITRRTKQLLDEGQRKAFLHSQFTAIKEQLFGDEEEEVTRLKERAASLELPEAVKEHFEKELGKLERSNPQTPDYSVQYNFLDTLLSLPWGVFDEDSRDLPAAEAVLNADHYGLEKVKERILEQLAVLMSVPDGRAPILCLVGAPGVGKTSLGQSVAKAMGRRYQRVALGGLHDEAEIRGHRRTYIGAMPGRIIEAVRRAGAANPVILLDEIDKLGNDYKGDPSSALLEVLDPEQNCRFHDNYIDVDFDLSRVLFIATANSLSSIPQPLLDRMEVVEISGYLLEEKLEIARRHLIPRLMAEMGIDPESLSIPDVTISAVVENYTAESGVRQLEKRLAAIMRKVLLARMRDGEVMATVEPGMLHTLLGAESMIRERYEGNDLPGVVTGLAWTAAGGEILYVEASLAPGKGDRPMLTGNLGDVMKESALLAHQYVKAHAGQLGISKEDIDSQSLHVHVPEGAIPKDGPSAGITIVTAIVSAYTGRKVRERVAMTGEMTLRGRVLPVGGIKEKILAAKRAGIDTIILSQRNRKDVEDIKPMYLEGLTFEYVDTIDRVIDIALLPSGE